MRKFKSLKSGNGFLAYGFEGSHAHLVAALIQFLVLMSYIGELGFPDLLNPFNKNLCRKCSD